ncbi:C-X-C motif chemokine 11-1-like [Chanos chanos]|uniref:C-X-C motif chemokine 11-1-like n=1 Tax=Chanos chanos TaxID=29144 RepID=A0A6J2USZ7_CHACN|nr:C-X-C motif chemokine 11-1-like [Chanos chanos]
MKSTVALLPFVCLLVVNVEGAARPLTSRCKCQDVGVERVHPARVQKIELLPPSSSCSKLEIIVHLKNGAGRRCLNPESHFAKVYIQRAIQKKVAEEGAMNSPDSRKIQPTVTSQNKIMSTVFFTRKPTVSQPSQ